jgi:hypothetical protein
MKRTRILFWMTGILFAAGVSVAAQHGNSAAPKPAHGGSTPHATAPTSHGASKPVHSTQSTTHGSSAKMQKPVKPMTGTAKAATPTKAAKATKPVKSPKPVDTSASNATTKASKKDAKSGTTTTSTSTGTGSTTTELTAVQTKLQKNANLAAKLKSRLPAGTDLMTAAAGFKNLGQFVAAVNVSNNLGIPFAQLKTKMVTDGSSLGQAIQSLRPVSSATVEAQRAEYDARGMIAESEQQQAAATAASSGTTATTKKAAKDKSKSKKTAGPQPGS